VEFQTAEKSLNEDFLPYKTPKEKQTKNLHSPVAKPPQWSQLLLDTLLIFPRNHHHCTD